MMNPTLKEARRLFLLGAAVHWLHPKSKRPVEAGWTTGPRKEWDYLKETYRDGMNVGVRLGTPSRLECGGYLAVIDVDVKGGDKRYRKEALAAARKLVGFAVAPEVTSGRGNGSRHYYCVTEAPFKTWNPAASDEQVKVLMPSKSPSKRELEELSAKEIKEGWRLSKAWEISLYSDGRQVVVPPSIHPDTEKPYSWAFPWELSPPRLRFPAGPEVATAKKERVAKGEREATTDLRIDPMLDVRWLPDLSEDVRAAIVKGTGVTDRSAYLLRAAHALHSAGLDRDGIVSVLTDGSTFLGKCAYDHAKTESRARAADWVWNYTVRKVVKERDPVSAFRGVPVERQEAASSDDELDDSEVDWRGAIERTGQKKDGPPKCTVNNLELIMTNAIGGGLFKRDLFSFRDMYGMDAPWGAKVGAAILDDDIPLIKSWFGHNWGIEPGKDLLFDAITLMARMNAFDPVRDWLDGLAEWDRKPRLDGWLAGYFEGEGDKAYLAQVFRKWMVAMVMRVYSPGAKFDWMPIFEGAQGVGKSSFGRLLVGDTYFLDWLPNLADKDSALALQGAWAVEMGELASMRKNEVDIVKAYLTRTVDKFRPPFGRRLLESPRRCVFYGTTNRETYLRDETGNRRLKPVKVGQLDFDALERDRDQLFAEAKWLWDSYAETELTLDLTGAAREYELQIQADKMVEDDSDLMVEQLLDFADRVAADQAVFNFDKFSLQDLFSGIGPFQKWRFDNRSAQFAGRALKKVGATSWKSDGRKVWKWGLRDRSGEPPIPVDFF